MIEVVNIGSSTVSVRDDLAPRVAAVCLRCKGFETVLITDYQSPEWPDPGFIRVMHRVICPSCHGKGLYYHDEQRPQSQ